MKGKKMSNLTAAQVAKFNRIIAGTANAQDAHVEGWIGANDMRADIAALEATLAEGEDALYRAYRKSFR